MALAATVLGLAMLGPRAGTPAAPAGTNLQRLDALAQALICFSRARDAGHEFLASRDPAASERHDRHVLAAAEALRRLGGLGAAAAELAPCFTALEAHQRSFAVVVALQRARGLDENQGLEGRLREDAHAVERLVGALARPELAAAYLTVRRHEKDLLLRARSEYRRAVADATAAFLVGAAAAGVTGPTFDAVQASWTRYSSTLAELVDVLARLEGAKSDWLRAGADFAALVDERMRESVAAPAPALAPTLAPDPAAAPR